MDLAGRTGPNESDPGGFRREADAEEEKESVIDIDVDEAEYGLSPDKESR